MSQTVATRAFACKAGIVIVNGHWAVVPDDSDYRTFWVPFKDVPKGTCSGDSLTVHAARDTNGIWQPVWVEVTRP